MIVPCNMKKRAWPLFWAVCISVILALPARGQGPGAQDAGAQDAGAQQGEIKAVVRISKQLIEDVASRVDVVATIPYRAKVLGFWAQGVIDGQGKLSVDLRTEQGQGTAIVHATGTGETYARAVRGPIVAMGPASGSFEAWATVRFDGRKFSLGEISPSSVVHGQLDRVEGRRGGPIGRVAGRLILPLGRRLVPLAERRAVPIANNILTTFVNELGEEIVVKLNRTTPVEISLNRLYPETTDWVFQLSTDSQFIQAAYGPPASALPVLPEHPGRLKDARLELWLRTSTKEAQALAKLSKQPLAKQLVQRYLEATLPELAALTEERTVTAVGPWLVISIGAPKVDSDTSRRFPPDE